MQLQQRGDGAVSDGGEAAANPDEAAQGEHTHTPTGLCDLQTATVMSNNCDFTQLFVKESLAASRHVTERSVARWRNFAAHTTEPAGVLLKSDARPANTFPQLAVCVNINIVILQISVPLNSTTPCKYLILH